MVADLKACGQGLRAGQRSERDGPELPPDYLYQHCPGSDVPKLDVQSLIEFEGVASNMPAAKQSCVTLNVA